MDWWIALIVVVVCLWLGFQKLDRPRCHPKEPPAIPQSIPYLGHLIGIIRHGSRYFTRMSPIYTLLVPRNRIYIVNSPSLVASVDRNSKAISFDPYVVQFAKRIAAPSPEGLAAIAANLDEDAGCVSSALAPGEHLDRTTDAVLESVCNLLLWDHGIAEEVKGGTFDLFLWIRQLVTKASTDGIYGVRENPFMDPKVEAGFWAIDKDFVFIGLDFLPGILAPRASRGRRALFLAFQNYYAVKGYRTASRLVQARYHMMNWEHGVSVKDVAQFDLSVCYGLLTNTVPATSLALYYIYSQESLLAELRTILAEYVHTSSDSAGGVLHRVDLAEVIAGCPLLTSLVQETLRVQSTNASGRVVLKDTWLNDQWFLKKDSILLIPSAELHSDAAIWGPTCQEFDPRRFINKTSGAGKVPASAYRAFGGGASVCPGRYFAMNEIAMILVIMVLKYDLKPGNVHWKMPKSRRHITTSILTPDGGVPVKISQSEGTENSRWEFTWGGGRSQSTPYHKTRN